MAPITRSSGLLHCCSVGETQTQQMTHCMSFAQSGVGDAVRWGGWGAGEAATRTLAHLYRAALIPSPVVGYLGWAG